MEKIMANKKQIKCEMEDQKSKTPIRNSKNNKSVFMVCILIIIVLQMNCTEPLSKECKDFLNTPSSQIEREFAEYDLEKQLTIHYCALSIRPPTGIYANRIAKRGKGIIPILLQKLTSNDSKSRHEKEKTKYAIILIFQSLSWNGELDNNKQIIKILEQTVSEIRTTWIKEEAEKALADIKKESDM
jgi:hypothetical protein